MCDETRQVEQQQQSLVAPRNSLVFQVGLAELVVINNCLPANESGQKYITQHTLTFFISFVGQVLFIVKLPLAELR